MILAIANEAWLIVFEGRTARLRDSRGLQYLARLLAEPARELHALDLVGAEIWARHAWRPG